MGHAGSHGLPAAVASGPARPCHLGGAPAPSSHDSGRAGPRPARRGRSPQSVRPRCAAGLRRLQLHNLHPHRAPPGGRRAAGGRQGPQDRGPVPQAEGCGAGGGARRSGAGRGGTTLPAPARGTAPSPPLRGRQRRAPLPRLPPPGRDWSLLLHLGPALASARSCKATGLAAVADAGRQAAATGRRASSRAREGCVRAPAGAGPARLARRLQVEPGPASAQARGSACGLRLGKEGGSGARQGLVRGCLPPPGRSLGPQSGGLPSGTGLRGAAPAVLWPRSGGPRKGPRVPRRRTAQRAVVGRRVPVPEGPRPLVGAVKPAGQAATGQAFSSKFGGGGRRGGGWLFYRPQLCDGDSVSRGGRGTLLRGAVAGELPAVAGVGPPSCAACLRGQPCQLGGFSLPYPRQSENGCE